MADVTREEFDALTARVIALEGKSVVVPPTTTPAPTEPATPTPEAPAEAVVLSAPQVTVTGSAYALSGLVVANQPTKFHYLQLAVRGGGAKDLDLRPGSRLAAKTAVRLTGRGTGSGNYTAWVAYSLDGQTWVDGPKTAFTVAADASTPGTPDPGTPDPGTPGTPGTGTPGRFSGLPFNSLVFRQTRSDAEAFGRKRGVPVDGLLYFTPRQSWSDMQYHPEGQREMLAEGMIVVTSMPHAPESEGDAMNQRGANNDYAGQQKALGQWLGENGFNVPNHVVRVDWECNGNWYKWSANRGGGWQALREAIKNYVSNLRAGGATKVKFDLCFNKGPNQAGAAFEIFPGPEYIDVIGIDQYDMWAPSYSESDWEREMNKPPSARSVAKFAKEHGIQWSWDEGGNTHGGGNQGGDNPFYWQMVRKEIERNIDNLAWHVTYDDRGAPDTLRHDFDRNPNSWPKYKQLWTP